MPRNQTDPCWISHCYVRWILKKILTKTIRNSTFYRDNLVAKKILQSAFFRLSENLKSKIVAFMVPPPVCTNLPFWATRRLERIHDIRGVHLGTVVLAKHCYFGDTENKIRTSFKSLFSKKARIWHLKRTSG